MFSHHPQNTGGGEGGLKSLSYSTYLNHISKNGSSAIYELAGLILAMINGEQLIPFPFPPLVKHLRQVRVSFCKGMAR